jgi:UDPglucose 6-dehydrogenase
MSERMRVTVVGAGYVGLASALSFAHVGHDVRVLERDAARVALLRKGVDPLDEAGFAEALAANTITFTTDPREALAGAHVILIAVGTPMSERGAADLSALRAAAKTVAANARPCAVLIRSTVPVGTCDELQSGALQEFSVVSNPEFLREGRALADSLGPERIVVGGDARSAEIVRALFAPIVDQTWSPIAGCTPGKRPALLWMDRRSAELAKYASNAYLVTRLSFVNEIANVAAAAGADVRAVLDVLAKDPRIGPAYLRPGLGWGGSCFPKDTRALLSFTADLGYEFTLLRAVIEQNNEQLTRFFHTITAAIPPREDTRLALLGLAFKSGTKDMRQSPAVALAAMLVERGYELRAYDPFVRGPVPGVPGLVGAETLDEVVDGADAAVIATEWPQFATIDLGWLRRKLRGDLVLDGRCLLQGRTVVAAGLRYAGVCPPAAADLD